MDLQPTEEHVLSKMGETDVSPFRVPTRMGIETPDFYVCTDVMAYHIRKYLDAEEEINGIRAPWFERLPYPNVIRITATGFCGPLTSNDKEKYMRRYFDVWQDLLRSHSGYANKTAFEVDAEDFTCFLNLKKLQQYMNEYIDICCKEYPLQDRACLSKPSGAEYWKKLTEIQLKLSGFIQPKVKTDLSRSYDASIVESHKALRRLIKSHLKLSGFTEPKVSITSELKNPSLHGYRGEIQQHLNALSRRREHHQILLELSGWTKKREKVERLTVTIKTGAESLKLEKTDVPSSGAPLMEEPLTMQTGEVQDLQTAQSSLERLEVSQEREVKETRFIDDDVKNFKLDLGSGNGKKEIINKPYQEIYDVVMKACKNMHKRKVFDLNRVQLTEKLMRHICSNLDSSSELKELKLENCGLKSELLMIIKEDAPDIMVKDLNFGRNEHLDLAVVQDLVTKFQSESLDVSSIEFGENKAKMLGELHVKKLILDYALFSKTIPMAFAKLLKNDLSELSLIDSNITTKQFEELAEALDDIQSISLQILDLSHIVLEEEGLRAIITIINKAKEGFEKLSLRDCCLDAKSFISFAENIQIKVLDLDISLNENVAKEGMKAVIDVVKKAKVDKLDLSFLSLQAHHIRELIKSQPSKIEYLDLSENPGIEASDVGQLVEAWNIRKLDVSECLFLKKDLEELSKSMGKYKLEQLRNYEVSRKHDQKWTEEVERILEKVATEVELNRKL